MFKMDKNQFLNCCYFVCSKNNSSVSNFLWKGEISISTTVPIWGRNMTFFHSLKDTVSYLMKVHSFRSYYCSKWWQSDIVKCMSLNLKDFWTWKDFIPSRDTDSYQTWMNQKKKFSSKMISMLFHLNPQKLLLFKHSKVIKLSIASD